MDAPNMGAQIHKENVFHKIYWKKFTNNHVNSYCFLFVFLYYEPTLLIFTGIYRESTGIYENRDFKSTGNAGNRYSLYKIYKDSLSLLQGNTCKWENENNLSVFWNSNKKMSGNRVAVSWYCQNQNNDLLNSQFGLFK